MLELDAVQVPVACRRATIPNPDIPYAQIEMCNNCNTHMIGEMSDGEGALYFSRVKENRAGDYEVQAVTLGGPFLCPVCAFGASFSRVLAIAINSPKRYILRVSVSRFPHRKTV